MTKNDLLKAMDRFQGEDQIFMFPENMPGVDEEGNEIEMKPSLMIFSNDELYLLGECEVIDMYTDAIEGTYTA